MRLHETWTGAANPGDKTFGVGSVEGSVFTVGGHRIFFLEIKIINKKKNPSNLGLCIWM